MNSTASTPDYSLSEAPDCRPLEEYGDASVRGARPPTRPPRTCLSSPKHSSSRVPLSFSRRPREAPARGAVSGARREGRR